MKKLIVLGLFVLSVAACNVGNASLGEWIEIKAPEGCTPKQISNSGGRFGSITVLCEDGRIFKR